MKVWLLILTAWLFSGFPVMGQQPPEEKVTVVTTVFPLQDFVRAVGGERVNSVLLLPPGTEPHFFNPSPSDVVEINQADIFIYVSPAMEPWAQRLLPSITNQNLIIIEAAQGGDGDPHIWLDFERDQTIIDAIAEALVLRDEGHRQYYLDNAADYKARLAGLDREYRAALRQCRKDTIVYGGHFAFNSMAARYGFKYVTPYQGFSPDAEPGPATVAALIDLVRKTGTRIVFFEELVDPKVARVVSQETGARMELLTAAHNVSREETDRGAVFLDMMRDNLKKLREALECPML